MKNDLFSFIGAENEKIYVYKWEPDSECKGVVQIAHGMAEHGKRYEYVAKSLVSNGYSVYLNDHRGHGITAKSLERVGYLGEGDGFSLMVEDMHSLTEIIKKENIGKPIILLGHSMGSFLTQKYMSMYGTNISGAILSGTNGKNKFFNLLVGSVIAKFKIITKGRKYKSKLLNKMAFCNYNKMFKPNKTEFDWLCSQNSVVKKYMQDDFCGGLFSASYFNDLIKCVKNNFKRANLLNIPRDLPVYIFSGSLDPVSNNGKGIVSLYDIYKKSGLNKVEYKIYQNGRHEMLNEKNKNIVIKETIKWIDKILNDSEKNTEK